MLVACSKNT